MLTLKNILRTIDKISIILATSLYYSGLQVGEVQLLFKAFSEIGLNI